MGALVMEKIEALLKILTRIDDGESPAAIRQGSADFLSAVEADDIVRAEQVMLKRRT
jgi:hypothetical protein